MKHSIIGFFLIIVLSSCGREKIPGKPNTIGGKPIADFYQMFVYQEPENEYVSFAIGKTRTFGILLLEKMGERIFVMASERPTDKTIRGNWELEGRFLQLKVGDELVAKGEGYHLPDRAPFIDLELYPFTNSFISESEKVLLRQRKVELTDDQEGVHKFLYENTDETAPGTCLFGETSNKQLALFIRLYDDIDGQEFFAWDVTGGKRGKDYIGQWRSQDNEIEFVLDEQVIAKGRFQKLFSESLIRLETIPPVLTQTQKIMNLYRLPKEKCQ